ncbi:uncharacterized protein [Euwallacea fornicatus]|uniref:uncharacterized protein n=1 Tax=Euwallacea fornicatus TaxID=995702 RepID=UPI0033901E8D
MKMYSKIAWCILFLQQQQLFECQHGDHSIVNKIKFPFSKYYGPYMGILVAFDLKLVPSNIDADFSWNIEANYLLPQNESEYTFPPIIPSGGHDERRLFARADLYKIIEFKLESQMFEGRNCLLRVICEMALHTTEGTDVLGDLVDVLLRPSSSTNTNLSSKYLNAEEYGRKNKHCKKYVKKCPVNLLDFFSVFGDLIDHVLVE